MPYKVYWIQEPSIMAAEWIGHVSVEEFESGMRECLSPLEHYPINFLVDMQQALTLPTNVLKLGPLRTLLSHKNSGWFAFVGPNRFIKFLIQLSQLKHMKVFDSREEAVQFLEEMQKPLQYAQESG
jgi:hypothetical protein